jgi:hypothetical protein
VWLLASFTQTVHSLERVYLLPRHTQVIDPHTILSADEVKDLKEVFELFDEDRSGNIDMEELGCVAPVLAPFTPFLCTRLFLSLRCVH